MTRKEALLMLSHLPRGTVVSVFDAPDQKNPLMGEFEGLGLVDGAETIKVRTGPKNAGELRLDDAIAIVIDL